jgi:hypothetical protein
MNRMRAVITAAVFLTFAGTAWSDPLAVKANDRLADKRFGWSLGGRAAQPGAQCREDWSFGADGVMTVRSGAEVTTKRFTLSPVANSGAMFALATTRLTTNGEPDCIGERTSAVGDSGSTYVMFLNDGSFFTCGTTDTLSCYGVATLRR